MRRTRIIATLGPATDAREKLAEMVEAGVDVVRLNMSHAKHDWCREVTARVREVAAEAGRSVGVLFDLQGPSIRTGVLEDSLDLKKGDRLEFYAEGAKPGRELATSVNYAGLFSDVMVDDTLIVDNGALMMKVDELMEDRLVAEVLTPGVMGSRRHINLPGVKLSLPALTEKDRRDMAVAVECEADFIAGSFVRDAHHVKELRSEMQELGGQAQIVSKIEDQEAVRNLTGIIDETDVVMIARGDLGIEVHVEELPIVQRRIVKLCLERGKRVVTATHMLESMVDAPTPTRAEVTDVSNAVYEEADGIMLSGETSVGRYPVRCVEMFDRIARRIERSGGLGYACAARLETLKQKTIRAGVGLADSIPRACLLVLTRSGATANQTALLRPRSPIFAFTPDERVARGMTLSRGVRCYQVPFSEAPRETISAAITLLRDERGLEPGTTIVVISDTLREERRVNTILVEMV